MTILFFSCITKKYASRKLKYIIRSNQIVERNTMIDNNIIISICLLHNDK